MSHSFFNSVRLGKQKNAVRNIEFDGCVLPVGVDFDLASLIQDKKELHEATALFAAWLNSLGIESWVEPRAGGIVHCSPSDYTVAAIFEQHSNWAFRQLKACMAFGGVYPTPTKQYVAARRLQVNKALVRYRRPKNAFGYCKA